jgi:hypothetical protein
MSFASVTDNIKTTLENDTDLSEWVETVFPGKTLQVFKAFRNRQEINVADLPVCMITRPARRAADAPIGNQQWWESTVLIYLGFYCEDRSDTQDTLIAFEELVEAALAKDRSCGGHAQRAVYESSENDGGAYHPHYFTVMQFTVFHQP